MLAFKKNLVLWLRALLLIALSQASKCSAAVSESELFNYWATNTSRPAFADIITKLHEYGVHDANDLGVYLDSKRYKRNAARAIWLLAPTSNPLEPLWVDKLVSVYTGDTSQPPYFDSEYQYPEASSQMLLYLGQFADRHPSDLALAAHPALEILQYKENLANGKIMEPPKKSDSISLILSALKLQLYESPDLARSAAQLLTEKLRGPWLVSAEGVKPVMEFLLKNSKAEPDFLAQHLADACSRNADSASVVLWLLNESKDNPVAAKALAKVNASDKNKAILEGIQSGVITKEKAYDEPLHRRFHN